MRASFVYFVCQLDVGAGADASSLTAADLFNAVRGIASEAFGDVGLGALSAGGAGGGALSVRFWSPLSRLLVVRGPAAARGRLHAALALLRAVRRMPARARTLACVGAARGLRGALRAAHGEAAAAAEAGLGGGGDGGDGTGDGGFDAAVEALAREEETAQAAAQPR
jgi:hypothetical protein